MRTIPVAAAVIATAGVAQAQSPTDRLPGQADPSAAPAAPGAGFDEVAARRKLGAQGYRVLRNLAPNTDGSFSGQAVRQRPTARRPGIDREVRIEVDASGNVRER